MIKNKKLKINTKYQRKMGKYDTNFTNSVFIMYWKMNEKKKKKIAENIYRFDEGKLCNKMQI